MIDVRQQLQMPSGAPESRTYHSLPLLEKHGFAGISRLPVSLRIMFESVLRNLDSHRIRDEDVESLARWQPMRNVPRKSPSSDGCSCRISRASRCSSIAPRRSWTASNATSELAFCIAHARRVSHTNVMGNKFLLSIPRGALATGGHNARAT